VYIYVSLSTYVALKIATAKSSVTDNELKVLEHLSHQVFQHPGRNHVMGLLDFFEHQGPNGIHRCLVFDVMGPNSSTMFDSLPPRLKPPPSGATASDEHERGRYPFWMAKSILRQILLGIEFLHRSGIVHGDLQPGNILFSVKDFSTLSENELAQTDPQRKLFTKSVNDEGEVEFNHPVTQSADAQDEYYTGRYIDGKLDPSAPCYLLPKNPIFNYVNLDPPLLIKISDLGGAFFLTEPPIKLATPLGLRSPELILGDPITQAQDIWSFGCLMFEFITGRMLFSVIPPWPAEWADAMFTKDDDEGKNDPEEHSEHLAVTDRKDLGIDKKKSERASLRDGNAESQDEGTYTEDDGLITGTDDDTDDDHILQMAEVLGPVPLSFLARYARSHIYFSESGDVTKHYVGRRREGDEVKDIPILPPIETFLDQEKGADLSSRDASMIKELLRAILQFDPVKRPSAEELLAHLWFTESNTTAD